MTGHQTLVDRARVRRQEGAAIDDVLGELRRAGATQIDSVKIVREVEGVSLGEAKHLVDASDVFADLRAGNRPARAAALQAAREIQRSERRPRDIR